MFIVLQALLHGIITQLLVGRIVQLAVVIELPLSLQIHVIALGRLALLNELDSILDLHDLRWSQVMELDHLRPVSLEMMRSTCFIRLPGLLIGLFKLGVSLLSRN